MFNITPPMFQSFNPIIALVNPYSLDRLLCNTILNTDSYKLGHFTFEDMDTTEDYGYIEARKGGDYTEVTFFGLQYFILFYLTKPITMEMIDDAEEQVLAHGLPFQREGWEAILEKFQGYLPVEIKALREGEIVPDGVVQTTVRSTGGKGFAWCAKYVETSLLRADWFGSTVAARMSRWDDIMLPFLEKSGTPETLGWKIVDFGARGSETTESAAVAGAACLIASNVTDNQMGIRLSRLAYPGSDQGSYFMPAYSIPATEHSVTTSWLARREYNFYENIIRVHGSKGRDANGDRRLVSVVIDTYDQDQAVAIWGTAGDVPMKLNYRNETTGEAFTVDVNGGLRDKLIASDMKLVARPDSGDPITNVPYLLDLLGGYFGHTLNDKGYKMLPDYVGVIQGDQVDERTLPLICQAILDAGWSLDNVNFGSGGGLIQKDVTRDTHRYAQKSSHVVVRGEQRAIRKLPRTDPTKASKAGTFSVVRRGGVLMTIPEGTMRVGERDELETVYFNGEVLRIMSFRQVRETFANSKKLYFEAKAA